MKKSYFLRGSGGQGVQVVGMMLLHAIDKKGDYASFFPEYGASKRGGFSQCAIVTDSKPIMSFTSKLFDTTVVLNMDSYTKYGEAVKPGGTLVVNGSLIKDVEDKTDVNVVSVHFDELAREAGSQKVMNTLLFGFLAKYQGIVDFDTATEVVLESTGDKEKFREMNMKALKLGFEAAEKVMAKE